MGVFMFLGPTGVGKTELCKSLASFLFDDTSNICRYQPRTGLGGATGGVVL